MCLPLICYALNVRYKGDRHGCFGIGHAQCILQRMLNGTPMLVPMLSPCSSRRWEGVVGYDLHTQQSMVDA